MIASLPMYDRPETAAAHDRLWQAIRAQLSHAPSDLKRGTDEAADWTSPDLFLSQTCGLPYRAFLKDQVTLVATPVHDLPCEEGHYFTVLVARAEDPRRELASFANGRAAINDPMSQSGWCALWQATEVQGIAFRSVQVTGSHQASARAVAEEHADIAAIDAVTWRMIHRWDSFANRLRVIAETPPTPALPYITRLGADPAPIRDAIAAAIQALAPEDQALLSLMGVTFIPAEHYLNLPIPPKPCQTLANH